MKAVAFQKRGEGLEADSGSMKYVCSLQIPKDCIIKCKDIEESENYLPGSTVQYGCSYGLGYSHLLAHDYILWPN